MPRLVRFKRTVRLFVQTFAVLTAINVPLAKAQTQGDGKEIFSFAGFGTLAATRSSERNADFTSAYYQANGAGFTRKWAATLETVFGMQLSANMSDQLSAVVQVVAQQQWENAYTPMIEWANVKYAFTPDASIRLGRIVLPNFLASDSRKIGYTHMWVRAPLETYSNYDFSNSDGIDGTYRFRFGNLTDTIIALYGINNAFLPDGTPEGWHMKIRAYRGLVNRMEYGPLTVQLSYGRANASQPKLVGDPLLGGFADFRLTVLGAGFTYDPGDWILTGEWNKLRADAQGYRTAWHVSGGYRIGQFTPYITHSVRGRLEDSPFGDDFTAQSTDSLGVRWDFKRNMDLKVQFERVRTPVGSGGLFLNAQPDYQPGGKAYLLNLAVDFVF